MECPKCSLPINGAKNVSTIVCGGSCCMVFHAACVGVCDDIANCSLSNVIWLCDDCLEVYTNQIARQICSDRNAPMNIEAEITEMKEKLVDITDALAVITSNASLLSREDTSSAIQRPSRHSTPQSKLCHGSRIDETSVSEGHNSSHNSTDGSDVNNASIAEGSTFSLFLSNIDCSVNEREISRLVDRSLGTNETERIDIVKLVPKWTVRNHRQYASYKIVLDKKHKRKALEPNTWPVSVTFREFIEYPRRTWKPAELS